MKGRNGFLLEDMVIVKKGKKYGALLPSGEWLLKPVYDEISFDPIHPWIVTKANKQSLFTKAGFLLPFEFEKVRDLNGDFFEVKQRGKWGVYGKNQGKLSAPLQYKAFDYCYRCATKPTYLYAEKDGKWGIINFKNQVLIPFEYERQHCEMRGDEWVYGLFKTGKK